MAEAYTKLTRGQLAAAFSEWLNRYESRPDDFSTEYGLPGDYGQECAAYLLKIIAEQRASNVN